MGDDLGPVNGRSSGHECPAGELGPQHGQDLVTPLPVAVAEETGALGPHPEDAEEAESHGGDSAR